MSDNQNSSFKSPIPSSPWLKHIRQDVQSMHAYAIQDSTGMVKLDAMENPFSLPPALQQQLGERLGQVQSQRNVIGRMRKCFAKIIDSILIHERLFFLSALRNWDKV